MALAVTLNEQTLRPSAGRSMLLSRLSKPTPYHKTPPSNTFISAAILESRYDSVSLMEVMLSKDTCNPAFDCSQIELSLI
jgi:hypothetical protein